MAGFAPKIKPSQFPLPLSLLTILSLTSFLPLTQAYSTTYNNIEEAKQVLGLDLNNQKLSHFRLYWHDTVTGPSPTSVPVVRPVTKSKSAFGLVSMIDNPLTVGPDMRSKLVGRAQGFYASTCQSELDLLMTMNFAMMDGKYNGSTFTVLGRNKVFSEVREMAVVGGSGLFRFARGYVQARTHYLNSLGDAIVQYDCYVMHY